MDVRDIHISTVRDFLLTYNKGYSGYGADAVFVRFFLFYLFFILHPFYPGCRYSRCSTSLLSNFQLA
jgi:hypothetical protein